MTHENNTTQAPAAMMADQPKRKPTHAEIAASLQAGRRLSPALQKLVETGRQLHEREVATVRAITRGLFDHIRAHAASLNIDPKMIVGMPDDAADSLLDSLKTMKALEGIAGTKITVNFTSEVTVNGVAVPKEG